MSDLNIKSERKAAGVLGFWNNYKESHPNIAQFIVFFLLSTGMTVLQLIMMPLIKLLFAQTSLVDTSFQILPFGHNFDGSVYYLFDYAAGSLASGGGGGLAYFLAVQITIGFAQIINFFAQRNITFKSNSNVWIAAFWYVLAYIVITIGAAAAQGFYKAPVYNLLMNTWQMGSAGEALADVVTMMINAIISFWVFYPIFKIIFKQEPDKQA
jgi:hypothetical protein